jgi:uncharacterized protein (DUF1697 family)
LVVGDDLCAGRIVLEGRSVESAERRTVGEWVGYGRGRDRVKTWVALFRGINVGGNNKLPMKELVATLESIGCQDVTTYIQSGNAVFRSEETDASMLSDRITAAVKESQGFEPRALVLESEAVERAVRSNPFHEAESEPKSLHVYFLATSPGHPDLEALEEIRGDREQFVLDGDVLYLHAPDGVGRSRLAANAEKLLGVSATARNWRTVSKLLAMVRQSD